MNERAAYESNRKGSYRYDNNNNTATTTQQMNGNEDGTSSKHERQALANYTPLYLMRQRRKKQERERERARETAWMRAGSHNDRRYSRDGKTRGERAAVRVRARPREEDGYKY